MTTNLTFKQDTTWDKVFATWKAAEGAYPHWQALAQSRGYESWEAYRTERSEELTLQTHDWRIYMIDDPNRLLPQTILGPYTAWQAHFNKKIVHTFQDLIEQQLDWVVANDGIQRAKQEFPKESQFIGLYLESRDQIVLYEGHHRAAAITLALYEGAPLSFDTLPTMALTVFSKEDEALLLPSLEKSRVLNKS